MQAVVVGAGLAGLSSAHRLKQAGFEVTVFEKTARVGGRVLTTRRDGYIIDSSADAMSEDYVYYKSLAEDVGLGARFVPSSATVGIIRGGRVIDIDTTRKSAILFTKALSWPGKLRFFWGLLKHRKLFAEVDSSFLTESADRDSDTESALEFSQRAFGREATEYLIDPLIRIVTGTGSAQVSRLSVLGGLVNWSVPIINILGGLDLLPQTVASALRVRTNCEVTAVKELPGGVDIAYRNQSGTPQVQRADVCVIATTHPAAEAIYPKLLDCMPGYSDHLEYTRMVAVSLAYDAPTKTKAYAIQVPESENADITMFSLQHNKAADRVPAGHSLLHIYTDSRVASRFLEMSENDIVRWAREVCERLFPELTGHYQFSDISRWALTVPLPNPGFWRRTHQLLQSLPESSRVQVGGDLFGAGSMESAIAWGDRAARRLIAHHPACASETTDTRLAG